MTRTVRALIVSAVALGVLVPAGAASARPVNDIPFYCGPGYHQVGGYCYPDADYKPIRGGY